MTQKDNVGIVGLGVYLPKHTMSYEEIAEKTKGVWAKEAVSEKLGIHKIYVPGPEDGTQEMGAKAALDCLKNCDVDPKEIDVILCIGEEWKEYPLTTSALYIQDRIGAVNAWGVDIANRCCTFVTALKMAKDMILADEEVNTILIAGGYRNGDFVDFEDRQMSMMYNLSAGGGAMLIRRNHNRNTVLGIGLISDGSLARTAGVEIGGIAKPFTTENIEAGYKSLRLLDAEKMKTRLNEVSQDNWMKCIDTALRRSGGMQLSDIGYLDILHIKRSGHLGMLKDLGLREDQSIYLEDYGHIGQIDQILSLKLGVEQGKITDGTNICMIAAGIGYVWAAGIIQWGPKQ